MLVLQIMSCVPRKKSVTDFYQQSGMSSLRISGLVTEKRSHLDVGHFILPLQVSSSQGDVVQGKQRGCSGDREITSELGSSFPVFAVDGCSDLTMWNSGDLVADKLGKKVANEYVKNKLVEMINWSKMNFSSH